MTTPSTDGYEVVKWYTRARRFPQLIGKTPDGAALWGGPYTYTQVIGGAVFLVVAAKTMWLWGRFGTIGNILLLLGTSYAVVLLLGQLPAGARNPLSVAAGTLRSIAAPRFGHQGGHAVRRPRKPSRHAPAIVTITNPPAAPHHRQPR